eukprot:5464953-Amphidinium_carterae.1
MMSEGIHTWPSPTILRNSTYYTQVYEPPLYTLHNDLKKTGLHHPKFKPLAILFVTLEHANKI